MRLIEWIYYKNILFANGPKVRWLAPAVAELPTSVRIPVWAFAGVARGGRGVCVCIGGVCVCKSRQVCFRIFRQPTVSVGAQLEFLNTGQSALNEHVFELATVPALNEHVFELATEPCVILKLNDRQNYWEKMIEKNLGSFDKNNL